MLTEEELEDWLHHIEDKIERHDKIIERHPAEKYSSHRALLEQEQDILKEVLEEI